MNIAPTATPPIPAAVATSAKLNHTQQELRLGTLEHWTTHELVLGPVISTPGQFTGISGAIEAAAKLSAGAAPGVAVVWNGGKPELVQLSTQVVEHRKRYVDPDQPFGWDTWNKLASTKAFDWTDLAAGAFSFTKPGQPIVAIIDDGKAWDEVYGPVGVPNTIGLSSRWDSYLD